MVRFITRNTSTGDRLMKHFLLYIAVGGILLTAVDSTLTQMTMADCNAGVEAACKELDR